MRKLLKVIKVVAINLLLLAVLLEAMSIGLYYHHSGRFFYSGKPIEVQQLGFDDSGPTTIKRTLHPYFGFVNEQHTKERLKFSTVDYSPNNAGIISPYNYPYRRKSDDEFIVGVFGGSVAMYYSLYELENHVLANALKALPSLKDKQIVILPFAGASYKQPQQLMELNYFTSVGQDFDLVVNIDGFNETALAYLNNKVGYDASMPSVEMLGPLVQLADRSVSLNQLNLTFEILKLKDQMKDTNAKLGQCRFASCYGLRWMQFKFYRRQYQKDLEAFQNLTNTPQINRGDSLVRVSTRDQPLDDSQIIDEMVGIWAKSTASMNDMLGRRAQYFEVIQPNQHYPTGRNFTKAEQEIALDPLSSYAEGVAKGYPKLIARGDELRQSGVKVINAVNIFDSIQEPVYEDSCCHYNKTGNEIFARFVAEQIVKSLGPQ